MFRRRTHVTVPTASETGENTDKSDKDKKGYTPGKGKATPKRREAEAHRRERVVAPRNSKEAARQAKERQRKERMRAREGARRGDDRYLPARDKGAARALARDYVDSRRMLSQYFMWVSVVIVLLAMVPLRQTQQLIYLVWLIMMAVVVTEGVFTARRVKQLVAERLPDESTRGVGMYAAMRALQIRRLRMPQARVNIGDKF